MPGPYHTGLDTRFDFGLDWLGFDRLDASNRGTAAWRREEGGWGLPCGIDCVSGLRFDY